MREIIAKVNNRYLHKLIFEEDEGYFTNEQWN